MSVNYSKRLTITHESNLRFVSYANNQNDSGKQDNITYNSSLLVIVCKGMKHCYRSNKVISEAKELCQSEHPNGKFHDVSHHISRSGVNVTSAVVGKYLEMFSPEMRNLGRLLTTNPSVVQGVPSACSCTWVGLTMILGVSLSAQFFCGRWEFGRIGSAGGRDGVTSKSNWT